MKSIALFSLCIQCLLLLVFVKVVFIFKKPPQPDLVYAIPRHVQYDFTIQNKSNRLVKEAKPRIYVPLKQTTTQKRPTPETSHRYELISEGLGNQILQFISHNVAFFATTIVTDKADLLLSETPNQLEKEDLQPYLQAEKYREVDDPEIVGTSEKLRGKEPAVMAKNTFR